MDLCVNYNLILQFCKKGQYPSFVCTCTDDDDDDDDYDYDDDDDDGEYVSSCPILSVVSLSLFWYFVVLCLNIEVHAMARMMRCLLFVTVVGHVSISHPTQTYV